MTAAARHRTEGPPWIDATQAARSRSMGFYVTPQTRDKVRAALRPGETVTAFLRSAVDRELAERARHAG